MVNIGFACCWWRPFIWRKVAAWSVAVFFCCCSELWISFFLKRHVIRLGFLFHFLRFDFQDVVLSSLVRWAANCTIWWVVLNAVADEHRMTPFNFLFICWWWFPMFRNSLHVPRQQFLLSIPHNQNKGEMFKQKSISVQST